MVEAALQLLDEDDSEPTLTALAARTGVATPSLYKHIRSLAELRQRMRLRVLNELTEQARTAVGTLEGDEAIAALMRAWRDYIRRYPKRYATVAIAPLADPALAPAAAQLLDLVLTLLDHYALRETTAIHAARRLRAAAHGFAILEAQGGFGMSEDIDESYEQLITMVTASLTSPTKATK